MKLENRLLMIFALGLVFAAGGCSDDAEVTSDGHVVVDGGGGGDGVGDAPGKPTGKASLSFTATWGKNSKTQFDAIWKPLMPYYEGDSALVIMLCKTDDPMCLAPVLTEELDAATRTTKPIQGSFGPEVTVKELPAGTFKLMIFADGVRSRAEGFAWNDGFTTKEKAWKGQVSEGDMMMSSEVPSNGSNPKPETVDITLTDGKTADLGKVTLSHVHERDISPDLPAESGSMMVVVEDGVRYVNLTNYDVDEVGAGSGVYTHQLVDSANKPLTGVCGMVRSKGDVVYLLYHGGYAYAFDTKTRKQVSTKAITFDQASGKAPCKGIYMNKGGKDYLYVSNANASSTGSASEGLWYADVTGLATKDVTATLISRNDEVIVNFGFGDFAVHDGDLYASQLTPKNATSGPAECKGKICVFRVTIGTDGKPNFKPKSGDYDVSAVMGAKDSFTNAQGTIDCLTSGNIARAGIAVTKYQGSGALKDHDLLFVGGCLEIKVLDLSDVRKEIDFDSARAGSQGFDATVFGQNFASFVPSPDGKTLWAFPSYKSPIHFDVAVPTPGDANHRQTFNRFMALPISLVASDLPSVDPAFAKGNIDGHEGALSLGKYKAPADDPGVDLNHVHAVIYQMTWAPGTAGSTFQSASIPSGPTFAVTPKSLWMRGSGISGVSGLGKGGNVGVYDLASRRALMFSHAGDDYYHFFQMGPGGGQDKVRFGLDLTPKAEKDQATYGLLYLP
ncbi:MAG: hypothetical protein KAI47_07215 [Deltaproteobacteria bacterium]|nr:hypothetical protein [Deltaproteobacteria bacterium]